MKKLAFIFVIVFAILIIIAMYQTSTSQLAYNAHEAQEAQAALSSRPHDISLLKRPDVRDGCTKHPEWSMDACKEIDAREVSVGMTDEQARLAWGKPERVNSTIKLNITHDQWVYGLRSYLYVENGRVTSMQTSHP